MTRQSAFTDALGAGGPAADRGNNMDLYGWLVGSWDLEVTEFNDDGSTRHRLGEWHFGWVLEGRAIQDVWIVPQRSARENADAVANGNYYGTTLRVYDPRIDAWQIRWTDPVSQSYLSMIGRKRGDTIVQDGKDSAGHMRRWSFLQITPQSFLWRGEMSPDGGATWQTHMQFLAHRV
jgi:hypothetical protein